MSDNNYVNGGISNGATRRRISGALTDILMALMVLSVPMLALSAVLLTLIFKHRVSSESPSLDTSIDQTMSLDDNAYYINYNATRLITVASWSSTVAPLLPSFVMTLLSFPIAKRVLEMSVAERKEGLATPYQTSLLLGLYGGSIGSLWPTLKYLFWRRRENLPAGCKTAIAGLCIVSTVGLGIVASDTWLHTTTSTVSLDLFSPSSDNRLLPGRALNTTWCTFSDSVQPNAPCSLSQAATATFLVGSDEAFKTASNISSLNRVSMFTQGAETIAYLQSDQPPLGLDYRASTFAVKTICLPISRQCNLRAAYGASTPYNCTPNYHGDLTMLDTSELVLPYPISLTFFKDADLNRPIGYNYSEFGNPFYFGAAALLSTLGTTPGLGESSSIGNDPEIVRPVHGGYAWVLGCSLTVYDLEYTWVNQVLASSTLKSSNTSIAAIFGAAFSGTWASSYLTNAATISTFSNDSSNLANKFSIQVSQIASAMTAGIMIDQPSHAQQQRDSILATRLPKAPLFTLLALNLLYPFMGLVVALYVIFFSRYKETRDVQARLSVAGLVSACLEPVQRRQAAVDEIEELFTERVDGKGSSWRVGMVPVVGGGWRFIVL